MLFCGDLVVVFVEEMRFNGNLVNLNELCLFGIDLRIDNEINKLEE